MCWELVKIRARRRAEKTLEIISEYLYKDEEEINAEKKLEDYVKEKIQKEEMMGEVM
jgi:hypothetical protein